MSGNITDNLDCLMFNRLIEILGGKYTIISENQNQLKLEILLNFYQCTESYTRKQKQKMPNNFSFCRLTKRQNKYVWQKKIESNINNKPSISNNINSRWKSSVRKDPSATMNFQAGQDCANQLKIENNKNGQERKKTRDQNLISENINFTKLEQIEESEEEKQDNTGKSSVGQEIQSVTPNNSIKSDFEAAKQSKFDLFLPSIERSKTETIKEISNYLKFQEGSKDQKQMQDNKEIKDIDINSDNEALITPELKQIIQDDFNRLKEKFKQDMYQTLRKILVKKYNIKVGEETIISEKIMESYNQKTHRKKFAFRVFKSQVMQQESQTTIQRKLIKSQSFKFREPPKRNFQASPMVHPKPQKFKILQMKQVENQEKQNKENAINHLTVRDDTQKRQWF